MSGDPNQWMDRDDALAYIMRYPVVMLEETSGIPADGNFSEIYKNAMTVGLRNNRNIKKGPDVKYDDIFTWYEANNGFGIEGDSEVKYVGGCGGKYTTSECKQNRCADYSSRTYVDPEQQDGKFLLSGRPIQNFAELATFWYNYQKNPQYIPLFIRVKLNSKNSAHIIPLGKQNNYNFLFQVSLKLKNYIPVGGISSFSENLGSSVSVLYAHKSICTNWDNILVDRPKADLYVDMGLNRACQKGTQIQCPNVDLVYREYRIYVLRTALFKNTRYKKLIDIANTDGSTYTLLTNPKTILYDLVEGFMSQEGDYKNLVWKGINVDDGSFGNRFEFISTLCRLSLNVPAYPDLCACLGNGDEEAELKKNNPKFSFFCYSQKCFQGDPGTYKFIPSQEPQCPPIKMCDQRLEGNVFKFVKIDKSQCNQTINTSNLSPAQSRALTTRSHNAIFFTTIVLCVVFAIMVLIFNNNKNTV